LTAIFGHRGARGERPENTIEAFQHAKSLGLTGIECDVALTRDFVPVLHHDPELPRGDFIRDLSFAELLRLAPRIPTLVQALEAAPGMEWLIEVKTFPDAPGKTHAPGVMAEAVFGVLQNTGNMRQACVLAFDWRVLSEIRQLSQDIRLICLTNAETEQARDLWWGSGFSEAATPDAVAQMQPYGWAPSHATLTTAQILQAHSLGLKVFPWTVNEVAAFQRLAPMADGIITDFPSRFAL
jgi:glycerophosphoryl diester phosphodiesterase